MMSHSEAFDIDALQHLEWPQRDLVQRVCIGCIVVGLLLMAVDGLLFSDFSQRFWGSYLVAFCFVLTIALGNLFLVVLQHLTRAGWSVTVRRPAEVLSLGVWVAAFCFLPIAGTVLQRNPVLYEWAGAHPEPTGVAQRMSAESPASRAAPARNPATMASGSAEPVRPVAARVMPAAEENPALATDQG
ncbi:MAG: hypothetical protein D6753_15235, partial [Planctomycetota bacterium]